MLHDRAIVTDGQGYAIETLFILLRAAAQQQSALLRWSHDHVYSTMTNPSVMSDLRLAIDSRIVCLKFESTIDLHSGESP